MNVKVLVHSYFCAIVICETCSLVLSVSSSSDPPRNTTSSPLLPVPKGIPSTFPSDIPIALQSHVPRSILDKESSNYPSTAPSFVPSTVPSFVPSTIPSSVPSSIPSDLPSPIGFSYPVPLSSSTPSTMIVTNNDDFIFKEDAIQLGLDSLDLISYSNIQSFVSSVRDEKQKNNSVLFDTQRNVSYALEHLYPLTELFSTKHFSIQQHNGTATIKNLRSNETFVTPIYRSKTSDSETTTMIQVAIDEFDQLLFAEIRSTMNKSGESNDDLFFIPSPILRENVFSEDFESNSSDTILISYRTSDLNSDIFGTKLDDIDYVYAPLLDDGADEINLRRHSTRRGRKLTDETTTSTIPFYDEVCNQYSIVKVAIIYDAHFCSEQGGTTPTRNRILSVVATASLYFEREICTKLQLVDIYTPDATYSLSLSKSFTNSFDTTSACRGETNLLDDFTKWIRQQRTNIGIDSDTVVHLFTGATDRATSAIGCAYTSSYCTGFPFGVEYATFSSNPLAQAILFAHELGHNLGASHVLDNSNTKDYIMEASISSGSDGFGISSSTAIRNYLSRVSCDKIRSVGPNNNNDPPSSAPPQDVNGCPTIPESVSPKCISISSRVGSDGFACYSLSQILPKDCNNVRWSLVSCDGIVLRNSPRQLRLLETFSFSNNSFDDDDAVVEEDQSSTKTFEPSDSGVCGKSCILSTKNRICMNTIQDHTISYKAIHRGTGNILSTLNRSFSVVEKNENCRPATIKCIA